MKCRSSQLGMALAAVLLVGTGFLGLPGCERKEKVLDIDTPAGGVEVEKTKDGHEVDVDVHGNEKK